MKSENFDFYNKSNNPKKDWGEVTSKECGNEIRKAVMNFENKLVIDNDTSKGSQTN